MAARGSSDRPVQRARAQAPGPRARGGTDADGAVQLAGRLVHAIETAPSQPGAQVPALAMRAGYEAVADIHATRVEPEDLLARAAAALQVARTTERGVRIRRFEAG